jgi:hypothetical protein
MAWMPIRRLEPGSAVAEVDFPGAAPIDHPLEGAINGGPADAWMLAPDEIEQIVSAQMAFLPQEGVLYVIAFGRPLAACETQSRGVGKGARHDLVIE